MIAYLLIPLTLLLIYLSVGYTKGRGRETRFYGVLATVFLIEIIINKL